MVMYEHPLKQFFKRIESVFDKCSLSSYDRFHLLKRQLCNEPLILINSLDEAKQSYECAKILLEEAFADETIQKFDAIARLSKLKLINSNNYEFVSEMRVLYDLIRSLEITIEDIIQYFVWNGLSSGLQDSLINICNNNKPNFEQINKNIFKAIERQNEVSNRTKYLRKDNSHKIKKTFAHELI